MVSKMNENVRALYDKSGFRNLVRVPFLKGDGITIHMMMLHQIKPDTVEQAKDGVRRLHFRIGDQNLSYGPLEFCLISGLRFGPYAKSLKDKKRWLGLPQKQSQFASRVFPHAEKGIVTNDMLQKVVFGDPYALLSDIDALKACLLYTLFCTGLFGNNGGDKIGDEWLVMLDDLTIWNR